jgi:transcription elongation GreA/GreB family factor
MKALHLYCVVGAADQREFSDIGADHPCLSTGQVFTVHHHDIAAVVGPAPRQAYRSMRKEEIIPHLFAHQAVIEKVLQEHTVVPVKFGTMARDEEEVRAILEKGYPQLRAALEAMEGKIELDVVALWRDLGSVLREIGEEEEIRRARAGIENRPPEETTEGRVRIGKLVKVRLDRCREERATDIVQALEGLAQDMLPHALLDDRMILNTAILVERSREGEVGQALERLNGQCAERVDFRCVGPLPPYSFSTVEVRRFEAEKIAWARRVLALGEQATLRDVKAAYRGLAHHCHPDKAPIRHGTDKCFGQVTEAYRMLADYHAAAEEVPPGADPTDVVAVKLFRWGVEGCGV